MMSLTGFIYVGRQEMPKKECFICRKEVHSEHEYIKICQDIVIRKESICDKCYNERLK